VSLTFPSVRCREIAVPDFDLIADLLRGGLPTPSPDFWMRALDRLSKHAAPPDFPRYGHLLECNGVPVGVHLLIFATIEVNGEPSIRCNVSSWYVEPAYRCYAAILASRALGYKDVTYFNITPATNTLPTLEAMGYVRYCSGRFVTAPAVLKGGWNTKIRRITRTSSAHTDLGLFENVLLRQHADYGCISLTCSLSGLNYPFVFLPLRKARVVPYVYLAYCRQLEDFVRFAGPLGRFLARLGYLLIVMDANGPIKGLVGRYLDGTPKYFKGAHQPRLGDMAYSERVIFQF
jgi:hypothetical protein